MPTQFPTSMKTGVDCGEIALESSRRNMFSDMQQAQTYNLAEGSRESEDSERKGDCREALRLRKESRPDVVSHGYLLKGLGPERKIEGQYRSLRENRYSTLNNGLNLPVSHGYPLGWGSMTVKWIVLRDAED